MAVWWRHVGVCGVGMCGVASPRSGARVRVARGQRKRWTGKLTSVTPLSSGSPPPHSGGLGVSGRVQVVCGCVQVVCGCLRVVFSHRPDKRVAWDVA